MYQKYETNPHFQESFTGRKDSPIFLGHLKDIQPLVNDLLKNGQESRFYQNVFCPERDKDKYTFEKNVSWMLGGIKGERHFLLISDLDHYQQGIQSRIKQIKELLSKGVVVKKQDVVHKSEKKSDTEISNLGATYDEIRWLVDNGYRFEASRKNPKETLAIPSVTPPGITRSIIIKDYYGLSGEDCDDNVLTELEKLNDLFDDIAKQRLNSQTVFAPPRIQNRWACSQLTTPIDIDSLTIGMDSLQINIPKPNKVSTTVSTEISSTTTTTRSSAPVSASPQKDTTPRSSFYNSSRYSNDNAGSWRSNSGTNNNSQRNFFNKQRVDTDTNWRRGSKLAEQNKDSNDKNSKNNADDWSTVRRGW